MQEARRSFAGECALRAVQVSVLCARRLASKTIQMSFHGLFASRWLVLALKTIQVFAHVLHAKMTCTEDDLPVCFCVNSGYFPWFLVMTTFREPDSLET